MDTSTESIRNGVDTIQLFGTLDAVEADPSIARFQFRARNRWVGGAHNRSTIRDFDAANQEDTSRAREFVLRRGELPSCWEQTPGRIRRNTSYTHSPRALPRRWCTSAPPAAST